jgi:hypothetical protein
LAKPVGQMPASGMALSEEVTAPWELDRCSRRPL